MSEPGNDRVSVVTEKGSRDAPLRDATRAHADVTAPQRWRDRKWLAIVEFALVGLIFYADHRGWIPISKTPELLLLGWISLRVRGLRWRDVGLTRGSPPNSLEKTRSLGDAESHESEGSPWKSGASAPRISPRSGEGFSPGKIVVLGVGLGAVLEAFQLLVTQPILAKILGRQPDLELFRTLTGNLKMTALFIALSWTLAAFGEEMVWRGYLMNRVADVFGRGRAAWVASLVIVSAVFGFAHEYQGLTGWIEEAIAGLALGLMYLRTRRNLWVPIVAHGVADTIDMLLIFLGKMPGM